MKTRYFKDDYPRIFYWKFSDEGSFLRMEGDSEWMTSGCTIEDMKADEGITEITAEEGEP